MNRKNKGGDWHELMVLSDGVLFGNSKPSGPAVQVTYARYGRETRYSHTLGIIRDGAFHPIQHIHDRNLVTYVRLLEYASVTVAAAHKTTPETISAVPQIMTEALRKRAMMEALIDLGRVSHEEPKQVQNVQPVPRSKSGFGASIGDMLKAKGQ